MRMNILKWTLIFGVLASPKVAFAQTQAAIFNGKDFTGWIQRGGKATYAVEGGEIVGTSVTNTPNTFLCTAKTYGDFILEYEFKVDERLNSGVQIRSQTQGSRTGRVNGPQVEIEASPGESGYIYGEATGRGWLVPDDVRKPHSHLKNGEWNQYRVLAKGPRIQTWINGQPVADLTRRLAGRA